MRDRTRQAIKSFVPVVRNRSASQRAERLLNEGIIAHPSLGDIEFDSGACWNYDLPRTAGRYIHGFLFFADWHHSVLQSSPQAVVFASSVMLSWARVNATKPGSSQMAFHDETTAQRCLQIVHFLDEYGADISLQDFEALRSVVHYTIELLLEPTFYAGKNNHGMFQDIALLRFAAAGPDVIFPCGEYFMSKCVETSLARLYDYFKDCFTRDGVHVENSPSYHFMVAKYVRELIPVFEEYDQERASVIKQIYANSERYATHIILPNGFLPPISDTKVVRVRDTGLKNTFNGREFQYSITEGKSGSKPNERTLVLPDAGYAIHRSAWGSPEACFVLFKAGYNSNYHHHADDLSLIFYAAGRLLLSEAGAFGYDYKNPYTKYAFSQYAHNTVVVDGRSQSRVDSRPVGVTLKDQGSDSKSVLNVLGVNSRNPGSIHERALRINENADYTELHISDIVGHSDKRSHDYEILWHLGSGVRAVLHHEVAELFLGSQKVLEICWTGKHAVTAELVNSVDSKSPKAHRFPDFGRIENGTVLTISSSGPGLDLHTVIRTGGFSKKYIETTGDGSQSHLKSDVSNPASSARGVHVSRDGSCIVASSIQSKASDYTAFYLYKGSNIIQRVNYKRDNGRTVFRNLAPGVYRVRSFLKRNSDSDAEVFASESIRID